MALPTPPRPSRPRPLPSDRGAFGQRAARRPFVVEPGTEVWACVGLVTFPGGEGKQRLVTFGPYATEADAEAVGKDYAARMQTEADWITLWVQPLVTVAVPTPPKGA